MWWEPQIQIHAILPFFQFWLWELCGENSTTTTTTTFLSTWRGKQLQASSHFLNKHLQIFLLPSTQNQDPIVINKNYISIMHMRLRRYYLRENNPLQPFLQLPSSHPWLQWVLQEEQLSLPVQLPINRSSTSKSIRKGTSYLTDKQASPHSPQKWYHMYP